MSFQFTATFATAQEMVAFLTGRHIPAGADKPNGISTASVQEGTASAQEGPAQTAKKEVKGEVAKTATKPTKEVTTSSPKPDASAEAGAIDYPTLQVAVFKAAKINKAATLAVAAELGAPTFKELPPEAWAEALVKVQAIIDDAEVA